MIDAYRAGLRVLFDGEVMGERLLLALQAAARTPREAAHFAAILQLETETKARLRPLMIRHGLGLAETADLSGIPGRVATFAAQSWADHTAASAARLAAIVQDYEALAALGPAEDQAILAAVVAHEAGLRDWARAEAAGEDGLGHVTCLLMFPIDAPEG